MTTKTPVPHTRVQFQVDRIAFFSDAVIAIAITLLVLEIKIPPIGKNTSWHELRTIYASKLLVPVLGMLFSFFLIGRLWMRHHELFEHVIGYNTSLIRFNLYFLFSIILLPVGTEFMMQQENPEALRSAVFIINLALCHLFFLLLVYVILNKKGHMYEPHALPVIRKLRDDSLWFFIFLAVAVILLFVKEEWALYSVGIIAIKRLYTRFKSPGKNKPAHQGLH